MEADRLLGVDFAPRELVQPRVESAARTAMADAIAMPLAAPVAAAAAALPLQHSPQSGPSSPNKAAALATLMARHDASCPHCTCVTGHTRTVFGEGNCEAELMFIGEAPGEEEDRTGRPFVGRAGQKLDEIIRAIGLSREQVYIANVLKARPPQNRTPLPHEVEACAPFLAQQIRIILPKVIVALGGPAAKWLLKTDVGITRLRGVFAWYEESELRIPVMPTFHPAYLLRNYTVETRKQVWSDMQAAMTRLKSGE
jgi:uracil-DNA glycosylase family 4